jgi:hypothetical protein
MSIVVEEEDDEADVDDDDDARFDSFMISRTSTTSSAVRSFVQGVRASISHSVTILARTSSRRHDAKIEYRAE